jgi:hypothetical protein
MKREESVPVRGANVCGNGFGLVVAAGVLWRK